MALPNRKKKFEDCKSIVQSLLLSTPRGLSIGQLQRDYAEVEGDRIPFIALG